LLAALLAVALAAEAGDPCLATDAAGRIFPVCFDPGNRRELSVGAAAGGEEPVRGGALEVAVAVRWRDDLRTRSGALEWMRDMTLAEVRALFSSGDAEPLAVEALVWRGVFLRHRASPFLLVPGPRPLRLPFPFDVGLLVEAGRARWDAADSRAVALVPVRAALLLDAARHGRLRRLSFGPEVSWAVQVAEDEQTVHRIAPFTAGVVDARAESADGLVALSATVRGGSAVAVPGGAGGFFEAGLDLSRVVLAANDRPLAIYVAASFRGGAPGRGAAVSAGVRLDLKSP
jgi:hypothetical protein